MSKWGLVFTILFWLTFSNFAQASIDWSTVSSPVMEQVYEVNHFLPFAQMPIANQPKVLNWVIDRTEDGNKHVSLLERHLNVNPSRANVESQELVVLRRGVDRSQGLLVTTYLDEDKPQSYQVWVPELRKVRRFAQPLSDDQWMGTAFKMADMNTTRIGEETHELLGSKTSTACLSFKTDRKEMSERLQPAACISKGKELLLVRSVPVKGSKVQYDYRLSYVDPISFADYKVEVYKRGQLIRTIDKAWMSMGMPNPKANGFAYWYAQDLQTGQNTMLISDQGQMILDSQGRASFWSAATLAKLHR